MSSTSAGSPDAPAACAITAAHEAGIVHRDVKPGTILLKLRTRADALLAVQPWSAVDAIVPRVEGPEGLTLPADPPTSMTGPASDGPTRIRG